MTEDFAMGKRLGAPPAGGEQVRRSEPIGLQPRPPESHSGAIDRPSLGDAERVLENWFGRPVLLLASGRSALFLLLRHAGFVRHRNTVQIAPFHSRCVINALTHDAMPVVAPTPGDACLLYHQFGFAQETAGTGFVIEDLAHGFFANRGSGERDWRSDFAIFSLPKFFGLPGPAGGVIARTRDQIDAIRGLLAEYPRAADEIRAWMRRVWGAASDPAAPESGAAEGSTWLGSMYELLFEFPDLDVLSLTGFPATIEALTRVGLHRQELVDTFLSYFDAAPRGLWPPGGALPYGIPFFAREEERLPAAKAALREVGFEAAVYHVDVARNMNRPDYRPCVLLPAHHEVRSDQFDAACRTLSEFA